MQVVYGNFGRKDLKTGELFLTSILLFSHSTEVRVEPTGQSLVAFSRRNTRTIAIITSYPLDITTFENAAVIIEYFWTKRRTAPLGCQVDEHCR